MNDDNELVAEPITSEKKLVESIADSLVEVDEVDKECDLKAEGRNIQITDDVNASVLVSGDKKWHMPLAEGESWWHLTLRMRASK